MKLDIKLLKIDNFQKYEKNIAIYKLDFWPKPLFKSRLYTK